MPLSNRQTTLQSASDACLIAALFLVVAYAAFTCTRRARAHKQPRGVHANTRQSKNGGFAVTVALLLALTLATSAAHASRSRHLYDETNTHPLCNSETDDSDTANTTSTSSSPTSYNDTRNVGFLTNEDAEHVVQAYACKDGREAIASKLALVRSAKRSIVASLNYGGGECFRSFVTLLGEKMLEGVRVCVVSSKMFASEQDVQIVTRLEHSFPDSKRFTWLWADRATERVSGSPLDISFSSNHVKALVIDDGVAFVSGGTGIQDAYDLTGLDESVIPRTITGLGVPHIAQTLLASAYRDMDFVCVATSAKGRRFGMRVQTHLIELIRRWTDLSSSSRGGALQWQAPQSRRLPEHATTASVLRAMCDSERLSAFEHAGANAMVPVKMVRDFVTSPIHAGIPFHDELVRDVSHARTRVTIGHMYVHLTKELQRALLLAMRRGAIVTIVTNAAVKSVSPVTHNLFVPRNRRLYSSLYTRASRQSTRDRLRVYEFEKARCTYHKKVLVVDDAVWFGNSNLGDKSLCYGGDDELNFRVESSELALHTLRVLDADIAHATEWRPRTRGSRVMSLSGGQTMMALAHEHLLGRFLG